MDKIRDGEVIYKEDDGKTYLCKDGELHPIENAKLENSHLNISLYDLNKQIIGQLPTLTDLTEKKEIIQNYFYNTTNKFYMLYGKEISYFTVLTYTPTTNTTFSDEVLACLENVGDIKSIDLTETKDAVEIWVMSEGEATCLYLFTYDTGIVEFGG